jgi:hypothetical protein
VITLAPDYNMSRQLSGFKSRYLSKRQKMGDISKGEAITLYSPPKKYTKNSRTPHTISFLLKI